MDWFRSWHGAPTDPKWLVIAKRSETQPGIVSAVVWALFDFASQNEDSRGDVSGFDSETYAAFSGFEEKDIKRIIECLEEKNIIENGRLVAWDKRQPKREDNSTERVRNHRNKMKRDETQCNAPEKIREETEQKEKDAAGAAPEIPSAEVEYFRRTKEICGPSAGGLAKKLLTAKENSIPLARAAVEQASTKENPREYLGAIIRSREAVDPRPDRSW